MATIILKDANGIEQTYLGVNHIAMRGINDKTEIFSLPERIAGNPLNYRLLTPSTFPEITSETETNIIASRVDLIISTGSNIVGNGVVVMDGFGSPLTISETSITNPNWLMYLTSTPTITGVNISQGWVAVRTTGSGSNLTIAEIENLPDTAMIQMPSDMNVLMPELFYSLFCDNGLQDKAVSIINNGTTTIVADTGEKGLHSVNVTVDIPSTGGNMQTKQIEITENGVQTIIPDTGYDSLSNVIVTTSVNSEISYNLLNMTNALEKYNKYQNSETANAIVIAEENNYKFTIMLTVAMTSIPIITIMNQVENSLSNLTITDCSLESPNMLVYSESNQSISLGGGDGSNFTLPSGWTAFHVEFIDSVLTPVNFEHLTSTSIINLPKDLNVKNAEIFYSSFKNDKIQQKEINIMQNGTQTIYPDVNFSGFSSIMINTNIPTSSGNSTLLEYEFTNGVCRVPINDFMTVDAHGEFMVDTIAGMLVDCSMLGIGINKVRSPVTYCTMDSETGSSTFTCGAVNDSGAVIGTSTSIATITSDDSGEQYLEVHITEFEMGGNDMTAYIASIPAKFYFILLPMAGN